MAPIGEKTFSTSDVDVKKNEFVPLTAGEWDGKLLVSNADIKKAQGVGKLPRIDLPIEALDSATQEGGKNRRVYHMMFLSLKPQKDGALPVQRADQLKGLAMALGVETPRFPVQTVQGEDGPVDILSPQAVLKWLREFDGSIVRMKTRIQKGSGGYGPKAVVDYFIEAEGGVQAAEESYESQTDGVETAEEEASAEEEYEAEEVAEEEEEAPPPPPKKAAPAKKPAPAPVKGKARR